MAIAQSRISKGQVILRGTWMERITFVATTKEEAAAFGEELTLSTEETRALGGGTIVSPEFSHFSSPAHLQMCCMLILKHSTVVKKWVEEKTFLNNLGSGVDVLTPTKHRAAIQWMRKQTTLTMPITTLMFWAVRENFNVLYEMMVCNARSLDMTLSATCIGLVFCPTLSMFNHDCVPNAFLSQTPDGYTLIALQEIQEGVEICYSYVVQPVGLSSNHHLKHELFFRFGFHCNCPIHRDVSSSLYRKRVKPPTPLAIIYKCNQSLETQMNMLERYYQRQEWARVRVMCEMLADGFFPLIKTEPRLAFFISYRYAMTVPYCMPKEEDDKWLMLFNTVVTQFCTDPIVIARSFFFQLLHLVRKLTIIAFNPETHTREHVFPGCQGTDLDVFLITYINLRRCLSGLYPGHDSDEKCDYLIMLESHLFSGLHSYLTAMESTVQTVEREIQELRLGRKSRGESLNLTTYEFTLRLVNEFIDVSHLRKINVKSNRGIAIDNDDDGLIDIETMEHLMLLANYDTHPDQFSAEEVARVLKDREQRKKKQQQKKKKQQAKKNKTKIAAATIAKKMNQENCAVRPTVATILRELNGNLIWPGASIVKAPNCPADSEYLSDDAVDYEEFFIFVPSQSLMENDHNENALLL
jgi:hypothetical protein